MCVIKAACVGCNPLALPCVSGLPGEELELRSPSVFSLCSLRSYVGVSLQLGEVGGRAHEHAASSLQPTLLVREAKGLHELVDVDAAVLVPVDGDGQVGDGLVRDLHLQVDAQQLPGLPEVLDGDEAWRGYRLKRRRGRKEEIRDPLTGRDGKKWREKHTDRRKSVCMIRGGGWTGQQISGLIRAVHATGGLTEAELSKMSLCEAFKEP